MIEVFCETERLGYGTDLELPAEAQERWGKEEEAWPHDQNLVDWSITTVTVIGENEKEVTEFVQNMNREQILDDFDIQHGGLNNMGLFLSWNDSEYSVDTPDPSPINIVKRYDRNSETMPEERLSVSFKILHSEYFD